MNDDSLLNWLGEQIGHIIRVLVDTLSAIFGNGAEGLRDFYQGLAGELGLSGSLMGFVILIIGVLLVFSAIRATLTLRLVSALIFGALGLWLLSLVIH